MSSPGVFPLGQRRNAEQIGHRLAGIVAGARLFRIIGLADRVLGERATVERVVELLDSGTVIGKLLTETVTASTVAARR